MSDINRGGYLPRICLVLPFFGQLPLYWGGFVDSCADNPEIDFLIVTDCHPKSLPDNMHVINMSWGQMQYMIRDKFRSEGYKRVCIDRPYKLCDYKPAYGFLFSEELKGYEYWGYIDCDLVWGRLTDYLKRIGVADYDRIHRSGHLSIYKNTPEINRLFLDTPEGCMPFSQVVANSLIHNFDELGINEYFVKNNLKFFTTGFDATFNHWSKAYRWQNHGKPHLGELFVKESDGTTCVYVAQPDGRIERREVNYIHYMSKKAVEIPRGLKRPFCITHKGVFYLGDMTHEEAIAKYTLTTAAEETLFYKHLLRRMRRDSAIKILREIKYNKFRALLPILRKVSPWISGLKYQTPH